MSDQNVSIPLDQFASVLQMVGVLSSPAVNPDAMIDALRLLQRMFHIHKCSFVRKRRDKDDEPALVIEYLSHFGADRLELSGHPGLAAIEVLLGEIDRVPLSDRAFSWQRSVVGERDFDASCEHRFVAAHGLGASNLAFQDGNGLYAMTVIVECFEQPSAENCRVFQALAPFLLCAIEQWKVALEPLHAAKPLTAKEAQIIAWVSEGKVKFREDVVEGLEKAPNAFMGLLEGKNFGKLVVRVAGE